VYPRETSPAAEAIVLRKLILLAAFVGAFLTPSDPVYAQDRAQSLGDVARQNRKDKEKTATPVKTVLNDDNFGSGKSGGGTSAGTSAAAAGLSNFSAAGGTGKSGDDSPMGKAWAGIGNAEGALDKLAPLDRSLLAHVVLEGNDIDFPGRRAWEEKMFIAKEHYVAHSRQLLDEMKDLMQNAQAMQGGSAKADGPQAQGLLGRAQSLLSDAQSTEAAFKSVMQEGIDQAKQARR
jgi:hypothetical protein